MVLSVCRRQLNNITLNLSLHSLLTQHMTNHYYPTNLIILTSIRFFDERGMTSMVSETMEHSDSTLYIDKTILHRRGADICRA